MIDQIRQEMREQSADGIARAVAVLASRGEISPGDRLPTVRAVAQGLRMSSSTVGEAWRSLAAQGILDTQGRRGTFLRAGYADGSVRHFRHIHEVPVSVDLSTGYPDPELLPDLRPFVAALAEGAPYRGYPEVAVQEDLEQRVRSALPFEPRALTLGTDALLSLAELLPLLAHYGDRVAVGAVEFAPYLDLLERNGLDVVPFDYDDEGPSFEALRRATDAGAAVVLLQPRVHNPTGLVTSPERLSSIAELCRDTDTVILEVDHYGGLGSSPPMSAASVAPEHTVHLRSFSKDLHPDLRVCAIAGPRAVIDRLQERRIGGSWVSSLNQRLLAAMLGSSATPRLVARSKTVYDARRSAFITALAEQGVTVDSRDGFNVWVPVRSEESALLYLAAHGIGAAPGSPFVAGADVTPHIRVSVAAMRDRHEEHAATIAQASRVRRLGAYESRR